MFRTLPLLKFKVLLNQKSFVLSTPYTRNYSFRSRDDDYDDESYSNKSRERRTSQNFSSKPRERDNDYDRYEKRDNFRDRDRPNFSRDRYSRESSPRIKEDYTPIEKDVSELFKEQTSVASVEMYSDLPITIEGKDVPEPLTGPEDKKIPDTLKINLKQAKISKFTPIQKHGISFGFEKRDMMACSQTGSGKTLSFLIPIITHILKGSKGEVIKKSQFVSQMAPRALILAPTRELSNQIYNEARKIGYRCSLKSAVVFGGASINNQIDQISKGCDLLIATPGRLIDLLDREVLSLKNIDYLVFDEADRMMDMGFKVAMEKIVLTYNMKDKSERNTFMFSATFPKEIQILAKEFLNPNYIFVSVGKVGSTTDLIQQKFVTVSEIERENALLSLIDKKSKTLVFCERKSDCIDLEYSLKKKNFSVASLHGDKSQSQRDLALQGFKSGTHQILVATEIAARGLDINDITHVINYQMPNQIDSYVHRIGRTGRAGKKGLATSLISIKDAPLKNDLIKILTESKHEIPEEILNLPERRQNNNFGQGSRGNQRGYQGGRGGYQGGRGGYQGGMQSRGGYQGGYQNRDFENKGISRGGYQGGYRPSRDEYNENTYNNLPKQKLNLQNDEEFWKSVKK